MSEDGMNDIYLEFKTSNLKATSRFSTGHTYRNFKRRDVLNHNKEAYVTEDLKSRLFINKYLQSLNLTFQKDTDSRLFSNLPNDQLLFSVNKKKRWLMPELLHVAKDLDLKYTKEEPESPQKDDNAEQNNPKFKMQVYMHDFEHCGLSNRVRNRITSYFDNNGKHFPDVSFNLGSFEQKLFSKESRSRRRFALAKPSKTVNSRTKFKNGNRDRNSGIAKRSSKKNNEVKTELLNDSFYDQVQVVYNFLIPNTMYEIRRSWRSGLSRTTHQFRGSDYSRQYYRSLTKRDKWVLNDFKYFRFGYSNLRKATRECVDMINDEKFLPKPVVFIHNEKENESFSFKRVSLDDLILKKPCLDLGLKSNRLKRTHVENYPPLNIVAIEEADIICFANRVVVVNEKEESLPSENSDLKTITGSNFIKSSINIFEKLQFNIKNDSCFLQSIHSFLSVYRDSNIVSINHDARPLTIQIDLKSFIPGVENTSNSQLVLVVVYALESLNSILVNFYHPNSNKSSKFNFSFTSELVFETFSSVIDHISLQAEHFLSSFNKSTDISNTKFPPHLAKSNIFTSSSSVNHADVVKVFEKYLKPITNIQQDHIEKIFEFNSDERLMFGETRTCEICYDELAWPFNFLKLNKCGHEACANCWRSYLSTKIFNMKVTTSFSRDDDASTVKPICCLQEKCQEPIRVNLFYGLVEADLVNKYVQYYTDLMLMRNRSDFVFCENVKCQKIILVNQSIDSEHNLVEDEPGLGASRLFDFVKICECGHKICRFCTEAFHFPSLCKQAKMYFKDVKKYETMQVEGDSLVTSEGKRCPSCDRYMEKNAGCNHMSCPCGFQFCWLCLKDFHKFHTPSNGYFCKHLKVEETKYDSDTFLNFSRLLKNLRTNLFKIINDQRRYRSSVDADYKLRKDMARMGSLAFNVIFKAINNTQRQHDLSENVLFKNLLIDVTIPIDRSRLFEDLKEKIANFTFDIGENFRLLNLIIEFLALFLSCPGKVFKISDYSFKPNLFKSLTKAVNLKKIVHDLISNYTPGDYSVNVYFKRVFFYNEEILTFVSNIKHLVVDSLRVYEKFPLTCEQNLNEADNDDNVQPIKLHNLN
jgi:hypothetical protein